MRKKKMILAVAAVAALPLFAADWNGGTDVSSSAKAFKINTKASSDWSYVADGVADFPVTWRAGETVTVTDRSGNEAIGYPSSAAASNGSKTFENTAGGVWTLVNSGSGTAYIVVPWQDGEIGTSIATADAALGDVAVDTVQYADNGEGGINRRGRFKELPGFVAYSGDGWVGDSSAACTLKFTAPSGTVTTEALFGTGAHSFAFTETGTWTVELIVDGATVRKATIGATAGMVIIVK